jgi:hypothetical protein
MMQMARIAIQRKEGVASYADAPASMGTLGKSKG